MMDFGSFCPIEFKFSDATPAGYVEGYGSVFGLRDSHDDVVAPGAFALTLAESKARGFMPSMVIQHGKSPVGTWEHMEEDSKGLLLKGRLSGMDTDQGRYNYARVRDGALKGLSIGFVATKAARGRGAGEPARTLHEMKLVHVSLVDNPSNHQSFVSQMKSAAALDEINPRELEAMLRSEEFKLSKADAVKAVAAVKKYLRDGGYELTTEGSRDGEPAATSEVDAALRQVLETIGNLGNVRRNQKPY